jgi:hypothetical protein
VREGNYKRGHAGKVREGNFKRRHGGTGWKLEAAFSFPGTFKTYAKLWERKSLEISNQ